MYSHIIFDLDGTLIESLSGIAAALNAALTEQGLPTHSEDVVRTFIGDGSHVLCQRAALDQPDETVDAVHQSFLTQYPLTWKTGTSVYAGVHELIKSLQDMECTLSVLSNKPHAFTTEMVDHFFPEKPFALVLGQREGISQKPDPSGAHEILGELAQSSANSILVGDSTMDIVTARNAGISSAAVTWGYHDKAQLASVTPKYTAKSAEELLQLLTPKNASAFR